MKKAAKTLASFAIVASLFSFGLFGGVTGDFDEAVKGKPAQDEEVSVLGLPHRH
ncbi:hypothetical protein ACFPU1_01340 [Thalassorhabdus alkalitolerans]|uniref:Uncharacterized protein n=1 Tax=Thalassorhabdus alkalitolerans TaxID=2282697 RepID=A0ABW0YIY8_9BACI|nr:hypothetical protein [Thalassobacillus sp. C254]